MAEEDGRERGVPYFDRFISLPTPPFLARIHTGSNPIDATTRQPVAFITRLSNAPTAKRENNAKALHRDYLLKSITRCKEGERETEWLADYDYPSRFFERSFPYSVILIINDIAYFISATLNTKREIDEKIESRLFLFLFLRFRPQDFICTSSSIDLSSKEKKEITPNNVYSRYLKPHSYNARVYRGAII